MKHNLKKIICGMFAVMLMITCMIVPASATAYVETGSITVNYVDEGTKIENDEYVKEKVLIDGATFSAVLVAREENGRFEWIDYIKEDDSFMHDIDELFEQDKIEGISKELVSKFGNKLNTYVRTTDEDGRCVFTDLEKGIYLVWETAKKDTALKYDYSVPFLVEVPDRDGEDWNFNVNVYPKGSKLVVKMISVTGVKRWKGNDIVGKEEPTKETEDGTKKKDEVKVYRPDSITLRLYADGKEVASTTTNAGKKWAFSFDEVNALNENGEEMTFTIKEDKVKGYAFTQDEPVIGENTIIINVTNTVGEEAAKTGDETNMILWIGVIMACVVGALVVILIPSKKKENKKSIAEMKAKGISEEVDETDNQE